MFLGCRCYCHKDIPFETRKRKSNKKAEEVVQQPPIKKAAVQLNPESTTDSNNTGSDITSIGISI